MRERTISPLRFDSNCDIPFVTGMMKHPYGRVPLYMLQPKTLVNFAAQTLEFASHTLGYRDPCSGADTHGDRAKDAQTGLAIYSLNEVAEHETFDDCWIILYDKVRRRPCCLRKTFCYD